MVKLLDDRELSTSQIRKELGRKAEKVQKMVKQPPTKCFYDFEIYRLDPIEQLLWCNGVHVPLSPTLLQLLVALVESHGRLIEKEELLRSVWPDTFVEEGNLTRNISSLRRALGDEAKQPRFIETIPWRGYRFVAEVRKRLATAPFLKWINSEGREETLFLRKDEVLIGRRSDSDLALPNPYISRNHAKLVRSELGFSIVDLKSSHGTFVNGHQVECHELQAGDRIALGKERVELIFYTDEGDTASKQVEPAKRVDGQD